MDRNVLLAVLVVASQWVDTVDKRSLCQIHWWAKLVSPAPLEIQHALRVRIATFPQWQPDAGTTDYNYEKQMQVYQSYNHSGNISDSGGTLG